MGIGIYTSLKNFSREINDLHLPTQDVRIIRLDKGIDKALILFSSPLYSRRGSYNS